MVCCSFDLHFSYYGCDWADIICLRVNCISFSETIGSQLQVILLLGDIWQYLDIFFWLPQLEGSSASILWIGASGAVQRLIIYETAVPQQRIIWLKMSIVPPFKNPTVHVSMDHFAYIGLFPIFSKLLETL